jgi:hypothetical protein
MPCKTHRKANAPGLTAAQSSDNDRLEVERIANKDKARPAILEKKVERVFNFPERRSTPLGRKRTNKAAKSKAAGWLAESRPDPGKSLPRIANHVRGCCQWALASHSPGEFVPRSRRWVSKPDIALRSRSWCAWERAIAFLGSVLRVGHVSVA